MLGNIWQGWNPLALGLEERTLKACGRFLPEELQYFQFFVEDSAARAARIRASEEALEAKLWRRERADWHKVREELSRRLLRFSEIDPARLWIAGNQSIAREEKNLSLILERGGDG